MLEIYTIFVSHYSRKSILSIRDSAKRGGFLSFGKLMLEYLPSSVFDVGGAPGTLV